MIEDLWIFNDLLFSPTKHKWISRLKDLVKLSKTEIHFQRLLVSLLSRFLLTLNITGKTFSLERFCCIIRLSSCQNTSSNRFAKEQLRTFFSSLVELRHWRKCQMRDEHFSSVHCWECCLCCCLSNEKICKWYRSLFVSLLNQSFFVKWKLILHSFRWAHRILSLPRRISLSSTTNSNRFHWRTFPLQTLFSPLSNIFLLICQSSLEQLKNKQRHSLLSFPSIVSSPSNSQLFHFVTVLFFSQRHQWLFSSSLLTFDRWRDAMISSNFNSMPDKLFSFC